MIDHAPQRGRELFDSGFYCAESVLLALAECQEIYSDFLPRIATGFCSGMARTGRMCGAVSGAMMGLGLAKGRSSAVQTVDDTYAAVQELLSRFTERFGSTDCPLLIGCDLNTIEGQKTFHEHNLRQRCLDYVEEATRIAMSLITEEP
jgi:C_GCAxxG_C_C family probable redox protein